MDGRLDEWSRVQCVAPCDVLPGPYVGLNISRVIVFHKSIVQPNILSIISLCKFNISYPSSLGKPKHYAQQGAATSSSAFLWGLTLLPSFIILFIASIPLRLTLRSITLLLQKGPFTFTASRPPKEASSFCIFLFVAFSFKKSISWTRTHVPWVLLVLVQEIDVLFKKKKQKGSSRSGV